MITDNYIKMCEKNEDLQEAWKPHEGSWVKRIDFVDPYVLDYDADRTICYAFDCDWIKKINPNPEFIKWYDQRGENYVIWLPTQEQLVKMHFNWYLQRYKGEMLISEYFLYLHEFALIVEESEYKYYTPKEMMMGYLYQEKYGKEWTGKKWIIIK